MPRKMFDPRILLLATQATSKVTAHPSLEVRPEGVKPWSPDSPAYPWDWCDVTISAEYGGVAAEVTLHGVTADSERAFHETAEYQEGMLKVLSTLVSRLDKAAHAAARLGPKAVA